MTSIYSIAGEPLIRIYLPSPKPIENIATVCFKRALRFLSDTFEGLSSSRFLRAIVFGGCAFGAMVAASAVLAYLGFTPPGWITLAVIVSAFAIYGFFSGGSCSLKGKDIIQEMGCELGAFKRLVNFGYDEITWNNKQDPGRIFLGPMPNRLNATNGPKKIAQREHLSAVLSINAPGKIEHKGERGCYGLMQASTPQDWQEQGIAYGEIDLPDHIPLPIDQLEVSADFIRSFVVQGKNIYVHCKAGKGRSAMAIAAYMIKYGHFSADRAVSMIKACRPIATVDTPDKVQQLRKYEIFCAEKTKAGKERIIQQRFSAPLNYVPPSCCVC